MYSKICHIFASKSNTYLLWRKSYYFSLRLLWPRRSSQRPSHSIHRIILYIVLLAATLPVWHGMPTGEGSSICIINKNRKMMRKSIVQMKKFLTYLLLCVILASVSSPLSAQNARTFTYDAARNRVAIRINVRSVSLEGFKWQKCNYLQKCEIFELLFFGTKPFFS